MKKKNTTEEERRRLRALAKGLTTEAPEDRETKARIERFEKLNVRRLRVPEWRLLLVLAYEGPQSMYKISKTYDFEYATVHRATKSLEEIGWVKIVDQRYSRKNVLTKIYNLTREGLLWLLSKIPRTIHPSLVLLSDNDSLGLRKTLEENYTLKPENLETRNDVYLHLVFDFYANVDQIASNNTELFPLILKNWEFYREIGVAQDLAEEFPEAAFSTLVDYYHGYSQELGTLDILFTYKCYQSFLELYTRGYANVHPRFRNTMVEKVIKVFRNNQQLQEMFQQISNEIEHRLDSGLAFIKRVKGK